MENLDFGPVAPFDAAATVLTIGGLLIAYTWTENYGDAGSNESATDGFKKAANLIWSGARAPCYACCLWWGRARAGTSGCPPHRWPHTRLALRAWHHWLTHPPHPPTHPTHTPPRPCRAQDCAAGGHAVAV